MKEPEDGDSDLKFYLMDIDTVFRDILADSQMNGHIAFGFEEYKDSRGVRLCGEANGSLSFQAAAARLGPGKVPLSVTLYIDGTFVFQHVDVRVIYGECQF